MKITEYLKPRCPNCGSKNHKITDTKRRGCVTVRYHTCSDCGERFASREH